MASGTSSAMSTSNDRVKYTISIVENSTSTANNTSNVTVSVRFYRTNIGYTTWGTGTVYCAINGTNYSASVTPSQKITNSGIVLFSKTLDIGHNSDGSKTLTAAAYISLNTPLTSTSQSYSLALTNIPRASGLNVANGTLGVAQTITADRKLSSFTHTLTWSSWSDSGTIATKSSSTSWSFTPPLTTARFCTQPHSNPMFYFTLTTYNGSTEVGSVRKSVYMTIPSSVKPTCSISLSDPDSHVANYGGYVQGQSRVGVTVTGTGAYGSTISSYKTVVDGATYTSSSFLSNLLMNAGSKTITSTVTDSRSRSSDSASTTITVLAYTKPTISFSVNRCDEDGTENDRGDHVKVTYNYSITSLTEHNSRSISLQYKKTNETSWASHSGLSIPSYSASNQTAIIPASDAYSYDIKMTVSDAFASSTASTSVSTGYCLYHIPASGKGITFGGVAEEDGFQVKMGAHFHEGLTEDIPVLTSGDCNALTTSGNYYIGTSGTNKPGGMNGWLTVRSFSTDYCHQTYTTYQGDNYERMMSAGTWGVWHHPNPSGKVLWSSAWHMNAEQTATLSESISSQSTGIVLLFSYYDTREVVAKNQAFTSHFVPKQFVSLYNGCGINFSVGVPSLPASKYLYFYDTYIKGHAENSQTKTWNNVAYNNECYVLRNVIGV